MEAAGSLSVMYRILRFRKSPLRGQKMDESWIKSCAKGWSKAYGDYLLLATTVVQTPDQQLYESFNLPGGTFNIPKYSSSYLYDVPGTGAVELPWRPDLFRPSGWRRRVPSSDKRSKELPDVSTVIVKNSDESERNFQLCTARYSHVLLVHLKRLCQTSEALNHTYPYSCRSGLSRKSRNRPSSTMNFPTRENLALPLALRRGIKRYRFVPCTV